MLRVQSLKNDRQRKFHNKLLHIIFLHVTPCKKILIKAGSFDYHFLNKKGWSGTAGKGLFFGICDCNSKFRAD